MVLVSVLLHQSIVPGMVVTDGQNGILVSLEGTGEVAMDLLDDKSLVLVLLIATVVAVSSVITVIGCTWVLKGGVMLYDVLDFSVTTTVLTVIYQQLFS